MRRFLIPLFAVALILPACSANGGPDAGEDPKGALTSAFERMGDSEGQTMEFSLRSDEASLAAFSEGDLSEEDASTILNSKITVSSTNPEDPKDVEFEMVVDVAGDLIEMKQLEEIVYVRVDGRAFIERFGSEAEIEAGLAEMPPQFAWLNSLVDGEWIALTGAEALQQQLGAPTPDAATQDKLAADLIRAIEENAEVRSEGAEDVGDHLVATMQVRPLFRSFMQTVQSLGGLSGLGGAGAPLPSASDIPDEEVDVHFWIDDGTLTQVEFDVTQFEDWAEADDFPQGVNEMALRLSFEGFDGGVEAPDAAEEVDMMEVMQIFMGGMSSGATPPELQPAPGEGQSTIDDLCKSLEGAPDDVVKQFAAECPELQP